MVAWQGSWKDTEAMTEAMAAFVVVITVYAVTMMALLMVGMS